MSTNDKIPGEASIDVVPLKISKFDYGIPPDDLILVGYSLIEEKGLNGHHIESANNFYQNGINQIITQGFVIARNISNKRSETKEDKEIERIYCEVIPVDVQLKPPTIIHYSTSKESLAYPTEALANERYYSGSLSISCEIKATAYLKDGTTIERSDKLDHFHISKVPIIKGSIMCNTYGKSKEALQQIGEDPADPGGYFVVRGEWAVDCTENITFNQPKIYINTGFGKSRVRCEFISKPGDTYQNSDMILIRMFTDDTITIEIARDKLNEVQIPFYLLFRAFGWTTDKEMLDWIIFDYEDPANKDLIELLLRSMTAKYTKPGSKAKVNYQSVVDQTDVIKQIINMAPEEAFKLYDLKNSPDNYHNAIEDVLRIFDSYCLTHIGMDSSSRHEKLKFLALLIRKVILVWLGHIPQTDRDSFRNKRIHAAGENYAKAFKTFFNQAVVMPIRRRMLQDFNRTSFSQVNLTNIVKNSIYADDFERLVVQTIISGPSLLKMKRRHITNRLATQLLNRKNQLNILATMRQVSAPSADSAKQSERASEMRRVHMSQIGYICVAHSPPEGEKVGINKQLAIFCTIAPASSNEVLKDILRKDEDIVSELNFTPLEIARRNLARVFVNGHLIGYTSDSIKIVNRYRKARRNFEIDYYTTIYWDNVQDEVQFFVDIGRLTRPLITVYNNKRDPEIVTSNKPFEQGIGITQEDIDMLTKGQKTLTDLVREQKVEFITPEEQENCFVCPSFKHLQEARHNELLEYTHCDIPQSILGITSLTAPFGNHNMSVRVTFQTTQAKQTCGYYCLNWPHRMDKETFLQYVNETPLITTMTSKFLFPNGNNVMVAIMCYTGFNQEDSLIVNKSAVERGLFDGCKLTFYKAELEQKEEIGNPDASKTDGLKSANYEKLVNGVVTRGQIIRADDVLIGKYLPLAKGKSSKYLYTDTSIVYKDSEEAVVRDVIHGRNEDGIRFVKVALRKIRPVAVGDKFCFTPDHYVMTEQGWKAINRIKRDEKVLVYDPSEQSADWHKVKKTHKFSHDGPLYECDTNIAFRATSEHKMYVSNDGQNPNFELISDIVKSQSTKNYHIGGAYTYDSEYPEDITDDIIVAATHFTKRYPLKRTTVTEENLMDFIQGLDCYQAFTMLEFINTYHAVLDIVPFNNSQDGTTDHSQDSNVRPYKYQPRRRMVFYSQYLVDCYQMLMILSGCHYPPAELTDEEKLRDAIYAYNVEITTTRDTIKVDASSYTTTQYKGEVYCIEVPTGIFMVRHKNKYMWTGNSSRAGQKGICALLMREADMPTTIHGERPVMIFNPHGMPSRMTCSQLIESLVGNLCAIKGTHYDATMFKSVDIETIAEELSQYGFHRYGCTRMICGITGEYIDTLTFYGPTYYQRLQKFVADAEYSVRHALTDALTMQPLEGQGSSGGLKIGEMEKDVLISHGASLVLNEKFTAHSDGYTDYYCRCGKPAIVNHQERLYKCLHCKDNADIVAIPTTWTSKLFMREMESTNVGIRCNPDPFTFSTDDDADRSLSTIDVYDDDTIKNLLLHAEDMVDDARAQVDEV